MQQRTPSPSKFFFKCITCGTYPVSEHTARMFLTEELQHDLDTALQGGAPGAILTFEGGCPNCKPDKTDAVVELAVLKRPH